MKRTFIFVLAAGLIVIIVAVLLNFKNKALLKINNNRAEVIDSIKSILSKKMSVYCEFGDTNSLTKSYIKDGSIRISTNGSGETQAGEMLLIGDKMYVWDSKTNKGFAYKINENILNSESVTNKNEIVKTDSYIDLLEKHKDSCKFINIDNSVFEIPNNIQFEDMSKLISDFKKQIPVLDTSK